MHGLGEKGGPGNRRGRDFVLWNTDVLDPARTAEFRDGREPGDPRADMASPEFDPYYVSIPFFHHQRADGAVAASFVDDGHRGHYDFTPATEYRIAFDGGQYTEYVFAGPDLPAVLEAYTGLTGRTAPPPLWALGYHQCRYHVYDQATVEAIGQRHRDEQIPCDALWLDIEHMDGYRVFTWDRELFPEPAAHARAPARAGLPGRHHRRPRGEARPGLRRLRRGGRARRAVPHRGRRHLRRAGLARRHRLPRLRHAGGPRVVGPAQRRARPLRASPASGTT